MRSVAKRFIVYVLKFDFETPKYKAAGLTATCGKLWVVYVTLVSSN